MEQSRISSLSLTSFLKGSLVATCCLGLFGACVPKKGVDQSAAVKTTNISHTNVKWQSIGNCWIYAVVGWTESLMLLNGKTVNISESYITYNHWLESILSNPRAKKIQTGGNWYEAADLMQKYGVILEGDFIPDEASKTCSLVQKNALTQVDAWLAAGEFAKDPTEAGVRKLLDKAFGVNSAALKAKVVSIDKIQLADGPGLTPNRSLSQELSSWSMQRWYGAYGGSPVTPLNPTLGIGTYKIGADDKTTLTRVKRALNDHKPVLISWFVDFNAMDNNGIFSLKNLLAKESLGRQGGHMTVLEDYVAHGVDPTTGKAFSTKEGEATPELKKLAEKYGEIDYFVTKNSWGGAERADRPSYTREGEKGYTRLEADYLFGQINDTENGNYPRDVITNFVLPKGY